MKTIEQFVSDYNGKLVRNGGTQCVAVANQYQADVVGGGWIGTPLTGYANDWWNAWGTDSDYDFYVRVGADKAAPRGSLAVWDRYNNNGLPHIALVLKDNGNGTINCLTQNPGVAHVEDLTKRGLIGYLLPKKFVVTAPVAGGGQTYTVQPGDTLSGIGEKFGVDYKTIAAANGIADPNFINSGVTLTIPGTAPAPAAPSGGTVHLPATAATWRLYPEGGPYTVGSEIAKLAPAQFGGLSYAIVGRPAANVVLIDTKMFGRGAIYVGPDTPAQFS